MKSDHLEKNIMYMMLAFFLSGQAVVSYLVAAFLLITLVILLIFLKTGTDPVLLKMIIRYEFPNLPLP